MELIIGKIIFYYTANDEKYYFNYYTFSIIVTFANFDIVRVLTRGGPIDTTHLFATYAFRVGIESGDIPLGAAVSLFMFPVLAVLSFIILRNVRKRTNEV